MFSPTLSARIKQRDESTIHVSGEIRPFVEIAPMARETEIGLVICPLMLLGHDVFDMKSDEWQFILMESAIFTAVSCAESDQTA